MPYDQPDPCVELVRGADYESEEAERAANMVKQRELAQRKGKREADKEEAAGRRAFTRPFSSYRTEVQEWLWDKRIPIGEITMLAGKAGVGKSTMLGTWAAWLTRGEMRGAYYGNPSHVIYVPNEDSISKAVRPRMLSVKDCPADMDMVHDLKLTNTTEDETVRLILPEDCERMANAARELNAVAVFLDPLSSNMSDRDRNRPEVRQSYERLRRCAELNKLAIIGNAHLAKRATDNILDGILGSSEIGNIVRAALGIIVDPDGENQYIMSQCKNNYGPMGQRSYVYRIAESVLWSDTDGRIEGTYIDWQDSTERQVNDLMADGMTGVDVHSDITEATTWLRDYLSMHPGSPRKDVIKEALKEHHKEHTIKRSAKRLHVKSHMSGYPASSRWSLPTAQVTPDGTDGTLDAPTGQTTAGS